MTAALTIPTIGMAPARLPGQVLVMHDMLGVFPEESEFVKNFMRGTGSVQGAIEAFVKEVKAKSFPAAEHSY